MMSKLTKPTLIAALAMSALLTNATGFSQSEGTPELAPGMKRYFTQPLLVPGQVVEGSITSTDIDYLGVQRVDCYQIHTEPGSRWVITLESSAIQPYPLLVNGGECASLSLASTASRIGKPARLQFESRGGVYLVVVASLSAGLQGAYTLRIDPLVKFKEKELNKLERRGSLDIVLPIGTASTVAIPTDKRKPGTTIKDCPTCPEMVVLPAGTFMMGSPPTEEGRNANEGPRHRVTIGKPFAMGKYEVTEGEWNACKAQDACHMERDLKDPREGVDPRRPRLTTYFHALEYVAWLTKTTGHRYFLPSEAEWEYAARAGSDTAWNTGDGIITEDANFLNVRKADAPVGQYPPNAFGLYDTHGNFTEWVQDCFVEGGYFGAPSDGSAVESPNCARIMRGGMFNMEPVWLRSAARIPITNISASGFRVARALD